MKKLFLFLVISLLGNTAIGQTAREKKAAQTDLDNIKRFYSRLKENKIDTKTELVWEYTYSDTSQIQLKKLSEAFEKGGLKVEGINPGKKIKMYELKVSEVKKYSKPEGLNDRVNHLNEVAQVYKLTSPYASFGATRPEKQSDIGSYKKIGKEDKEGK